MEKLLIFSIVSGLVIMSKTFGQRSSCQPWDSPISSPPKNYLLGIIGDLQKKIKTAEVFLRAFYFYAYSF